MSSSPARFARDGARCTDVARRSPPQKEPYQQRKCTCRWRVCRSRVMILVSARHVHPLFSAHRGRCCELLETIDLRPKSLLRPSPIDLFRSAQSSVRRLPRVAKKQLEGFEACEGGGVGRSVGRSNRVVGWWWFLVPPGTTVWTHPPNGVVLLWTHRCEKLLVVRPHTGNAVSHRDPVG